jgi:hypothetical protein
VGFASILEIFFDTARFPMKSKQFLENLHHEENVGMRGGRFSNEAEQMQDAIAVWAIADAFDAYLSPRLFQFRV